MPLLLVEVWLNALGMAASYHVARTARPDRGTPYLINTGIPTIELLTALLNKSQLGISNASEK